MEIQGIKFTGPLKLDYSNIPEGKGIYIIDSPLKDEFAPQYIGYSANLKRRIRSILFNSSFPTSLLESKKTTLYYAILDDISIEEIKEIEKQLIIEYQPFLNKMKYEKVKFEGAIKEPNSKIEKTKKITNLVAGITSSLAAAIALMMLSNVILDFGIPSPNKTEKSILELKHNYTKSIFLIDSLKKDLLSVTNKLEVLDDSTSMSQTSIKYLELQTKLTSINSRLTNLEDAITYDAAKALSIPLIKKDLENLEKNFTSELALSRASVDRVYDQNKWFIVLMFTIALSVLGMAVNNFMRKKE